MPTSSGVRRPATAEALRRRLGPLYELSVNKWYFDQVDAQLVVRPGATVGRLGATVFERVVIDGLVNGIVSVARVGSAVVRAAQNGFLRVYAALMLLGLVGVALWFLLQSG